MAYDPEIIERLRRLIQDREEPYAYDNEELISYLDAENGEVVAAAAVIWEEKAAGYVELVDVQEGSSRRSLGDIHDHALEMAAKLRETVPPVEMFSTTRAIERP